MIDLFFEMLLSKFAAMTQQSTFGRSFPDRTRDVLSRELGLVQERLDRDSQQKLVHMQILGVFVQEPCVCCTRSCRKAFQPDTFLQLGYQQEYVGAAQDRCEGKYRGLSSVRVACGFARPVVPLHVFHASHQIGHMFGNTRLANQGSIRGL